MTATCVITRQATIATSPGWDNTTGRSVYATPTTIYTGPCRIQRAPSRGQPTDIGARQVTARPFTVSIRSDAEPVQAGDVLKVTGATDPGMAGTRFTVTATHPGSLVWTQDLTCEQWQPTTR